MYIYGHLFILREQTSDVGKSTVVKCEKHGVLSSTTRLFFQYVL